MKTASARSRSEPTPTPPRRILLSLVHLAGFGITGSILLGLAPAQFDAVARYLPFWVVMSPILAVGLVYALFGIAWLEVERISGLYAVTAARPRLRTPARPGLAGWLRALARQAIDDRMWRGVASFGIALIMGLLAVRLASLAVNSLTIAFEPLPAPVLVVIPFGGTAVAIDSAPLLGGLGAVASLAGLIGLAVLHRMIATSLVARDRRVELQEQVRVSLAKREAAMRMAESERRRIEKELHENVQPRVVAAGMTLGLAQHKMDNDPLAAGELLLEASSSMKAALSELHRVVDDAAVLELDDRSQKVASPTAGTSF